MFRSTAEEVKALAREVVEERYESEYGVQFRFRRDIKADVERIKIFRVYDRVVELEKKFTLASKVIAQQQELIQLLLLHTGAEIVQVPAVAEHLTIRDKAVDTKKVKR